MLDAAKLFFSNFPTSKKQKCIWFIKNIYYASWSKIRKSQCTEPSDASNKNQIWKDFEKHFNFIFEHYPSKNILHSPMVLHMMYAPTSTVHQIHNKNIENLVISLSKRIDTAFNLKENHSLGWLSVFGGLIQRCEELNPGILEKIKGQELIEFGPGIGFASLFYAQLFETKSIHYDLGAVTQTRNLCLNHFHKITLIFIPNPRNLKYSNSLKNGCLV